MRHWTDSVLEEARESYKSKIAALIKKYRLFAKRQDLEDYYYFDGAAVNLQREMEQLKFELKHVKQAAKAFGVKEPHWNSERVISRQIIELLRDEKRARGDTHVGWRDID